MPDLPLYNSKIISTLANLLKKRYPEVDLRALLEYAEIRPYELTDEGHWLTQRQADRFHQKMTELLGFDIAREGGRYSGTDACLGVMAKYTLGMIGPANTINMIGKGASNFTRSSIYTPRRISENKMEVTVTLLDGVQEKPYQCENRIGFFEGITMMFNYDMPEIEHPECMFRGGGCCRYIISWKKTSYAKVRFVRNVAAALALLIYLPLYYFNDALCLSETLGVVAFLFLSGSYLSELLEKKEMQNALSNLRESTQKTIDKIGANYNNARMVNEVGQALSKQSSIDEALDTVIKAIEKRLGYDRGVILLTDDRKANLKFRTGFGYSNRQLEVLKKTTFELSDPEAQGVFVRSFREQKPIFVHDFSDVARAHSEKSVEFSEAMEAQSFICCAIVCEGESLGVLAVDNMKSQKQLTQSDLSLLSGIAPVIGMSLRNAMHMAREKRMSEQIRQSQKMEAVGVLAGGIAHDFNNLLTGMIGFISLAQMKMKEGDPGLRFLEQAISAAEKAAGLIQGLLTFSRKQVSHQEKTDLNNIVNNLRKLVGRLINAQIELKMEISPTPLSVVADAGQIDQVVMNLVTNARDAMPVGGSLTVRTGTMEMNEEWVAAHGYGTVGSYARLSVTDTGTGIDEATKARILEPFFTTKEVGKGSGLGLAIVYGIVKQHEGYLEVDSEPGVGTTVNVYLPLLTSARQQADPPQPPAGQCIAVSP